MIINGGYTNYGESIGILMLDTKFPRPLGDIGNAKTFSFPVRYKTIKGASVEKIVRKGDLKLLQPFIEGAKELESEGVKAITTSCGFLAMFQKQISSSVNIPVFTSSLMQLELISKIINPEHKIGILTASKNSLTDKHFQGAGIENISAEIEGMEDTEEFASVFLRSKECLDYKKCEYEMIEKSKKLADKKGVNVVVFECTNMPPFREAVKKAIKKPVFDIVTLVNYINFGI